MLNFGTRCTWRINKCGTLLFAARSPRLPEAALHRGMTREGLLCESSVGPHAAADKSARSAQFETANEEGSAIGDLGIEDRMIDCRVTISDCQISQ